MNKEKNVSTHEVESHPETFDQVISEINSTAVTVYEKLNATNMKAAREEFLNDSSLEHPNNIYGNLDPDEVTRNLQALERAGTQLAAATFPAKQKQLAKVIIEDYRARNEFLAANIAYNAAATPEDKTTAAEYHHETNEALYGKADENTFYSLLSEKLAKINPGSLSESDQASYQALLNAIGDIKPAAKERFVPKPTTVERFSEMVHVFFDDLLAHIPDNQDKFTPDEAAKITNEIISDEIGNDMTKYRASVAPERANASVEHESRSIIFPGLRPKGDYTRDELASIIVHEFGTHVYRAINYEKHDIKAFSQGLPNNETWDEGVAKCVEQAIAGRYQDSGVDHYINIGLATFKGKNFREVFDIETMLKFLTDAKQDESTDSRAERLDKIRQVNFNPVQRCFRGTGELVNNKDLAYYNGANQVWQYIEENIDNPDLFDNLFLSGKSVATNPDQERLIYETRTGSL